MIRNKNIVLGETYWWLFNEYDFNRRIYVHYPRPLVAARQIVNKKGTATRTIWDPDVRPYLEFMFKTEAEAQAEAEKNMEEQYASLRKWEERAERERLHIETREQLFSQHPLNAALTEILGDDANCSLEDLTGYVDGQSTVLPVMKFGLLCTFKEHMATLGRKPHPDLHRRVPPYRGVCSEFVFDPREGLDYPYHQEIIEFARKIKAVRERGQ